MMKRFSLVALALLGVTVAALAAMPPEARGALDRAIADAVENARSGTETSWSGGPGYGGRIVVEKAFSQSTGQVCTGACNDPCRTVDYQISAPDALTEFHGVRCRKVDDDGTVHWTGSGADSMVRHMSLIKAPEPPPAQNTGTGMARATGAAVPSVARNTSTRTARLAKEQKRLVTEIQQSLKHLLYYSGAIDSDFGAISRDALQTFLSDERSALAAAPSEDVLNLLHVAEQRIGHGNCPHPDGVKPTDTVACAVISG